MNSPCGICSLLLSYTHEPTSFVSFSVPCTLFSFPTINLTNGPIAYWILVCLSMWLYLDKINHLFSSMVTKPAIYSLKCNFHVRGIFLNFSASKDQSVSVTKKKIFILNYMFGLLVGIPIIGRTLLSLGQRGLWEMGRMNWMWGDNNIM